MIPIFKISCSQIGRIMTNPKSKAAQDAGELSETAKSYCQEWLKSKLYDRKKDFTSKHTDKGNKTELDAIDYAADELQWGFIWKNKERKSNDFMEGECDVVLPDSIKDLKSAWDCFTFPLFETEIPETDYLYQINGYMELWGKNKGSVVYCLMDMPDEYIAKEVRFRLGEEYTKEQYDAFVSKFKYSHLPAKLRLKVFDFEKDEALISRIEQRVLQCRKYIQTLIETNKLNSINKKTKSLKRA